MKLCAILFVLLLILAHLGFYIGLPVLALYFSFTYFWELGVCVSIVVFGVFVFWWLNGYCYSVFGVGPLGWDKRSLLLPNQQKRLRVACISDTHGKHRGLRIPLGIDVLIHSGDFTDNGEFSELQDFVTWLNEQTVPCKILVPGNHDTLLDRSLCRSAEDNKEYERAMELLKSAKDVTILINQSCKVKGVNFYGSPTSIKHACLGVFHNGFQFLRVRTSKIWKDIPTDTDVLITHGPPGGYLDHPFLFAIGGRGDYELTKSIKRLRPQYHVFGHYHECYGVKQTEITTFINAASVSMLPKEARHTPVVFDVLIRE